MRTRNLLAGVMVAAAAAGTALAGAGQAAAIPDVVDRPYEDAKRMIEQDGGRAVVATRVGSAVDEANCLVANAWDAGYPRVNKRGRITGNNEVLVALNCNGELAGAGTPGNSAASPVGRDAKAEAEREAAEQEEQELAEAATPGA
jgi:hypothetical protein